MPIVMIIKKSDDKNNNNNNRSIEFFLLNVRNQTHNAITTFTFDLLITHNFIYHLFSLESVFSQ